MGAWGTGVYENDDAADWVYELGEEGLPAVESALEAVLEDDYLERDGGCRALAAADVVAMLKAGAADPSADEDVAAWVAENREAGWAHLVDPALTALARVTQPGSSEVYDLWAETSDLDEWLAVVADVRGRLDPV